MLNLHSLILLDLELKDDNPHRWLKDPTVGSAQEELQGDRNSEAHKKADQVSADHATVKHTNQPTVYLDML